jgi:hypothetical protein
MRMGAGVYAAARLSSIASAIVFGCTPFTEASPDAGTVPSPMDAGEDVPAIDAGDREAAGNADVVAGPANLLTNGDFNAGCQGWPSYHATLAESPDGRSGKACLVCGDGKPPAPDVVGFSIESVKLPKPRVGRYEASVWVRAANVAGSNLSRPSVLLSVRTRRGTEPPKTAETSAQQLKDEWQQLTVVRDVIADVDQLDLYAFAPVEPKATVCFLIDDVRLVLLER